MGPNARPLPQVRGREQQLAQLSAALRSVTTVRRSKVLLLEAAPGAGKTRLLMEAGRIAERSGFAVINGVPAGPPPRTTGAAADGLHDSVVSCAIEAARALLRKDAEGIRTTVVLDDLHLASLPTLTTLCDLIVALRGHPILWLLAFNPDSDAVPYKPMKSRLGQLQTRLPVESLPAPGPLSAEALEQLVTDCTGAVPSPALIALAQGVSDRPGAVIELVRGLVEDGDPCVGEGTDSIHSGPAGVGAWLPPPVPTRFSALIRNQLWSLSEPTMKALRLAAVLGSPFAPEDLAALLGEAPVALLAAVDEAVDRGLLVCGEHDLAFRTEPIRRVLLDSVPPPMCAMLRRQVAEMFLSRPDGIVGAALQLVHIARTSDVEERRVIAEASRTLLATDPSTAAALATRCLELAPGPAERLPLARLAVVALTRTGDLDRAAALAGDAVGEAERLEVPLPASLAESVAALRVSLSTALLLGNAPTAHRAACEALAAQVDGFQDCEAVIAYLAASYLTGDRAAAERAQQILRAPDRHSTAVQAGALTFQAFGQWRDGMVSDAVGTLRRAVALDRDGDGDGDGDGAQILDPRWFLALALTRTGEYEEAAALVTSSARTAVSEARPLTGAVAASLHAPLHLAQGRLDEAEAAARVGVGADGPYAPMFAPQAWLVLAHVALRRGALTQAEDHLQTLEKDYPQPASSPWWTARLLLGAKLAEAQANPRAAAQALARIGANPGALRMLVLEDPAAAAWCVRHALKADLPDIAHTVIDTTDYLRTRNPGVPAVLAAAAHARALAEGDAEALAQASRLHRNPWAQAAAAEDRASLLLDRGDQERAVSELDRAVSAYGALGGERDAARVRAALRQLGVRRRHWTHAKRPISGWESLTKAERKVADLVAIGLTNQQAAHRLFISPHTVGFHLRQVYRKLGIQSRTALIRLKAA